MKYSPHRALSRQFHALQELLKSGVAAQGISPGLNIEEGDAVGAHLHKLCPGRRRKRSSVWRSRAAPSGKNLSATKRSSVFGFVTTPIPPRPSFAMTR